MLRLLPLLMLLDSLAEVEGPFQLLAHILIALILRLEDKPRRPRGVGEEPLEHRHHLRLKFCSTMEG